MNKLTTQPTHTNRYLNAYSHHHPAQKSGVLNTLINRALHIADTESWKDERNKLTKIFQQNGYHRSEINRAFKKQIGKVNSNRDEVTGSSNIEEQPRLAYIP